MALILKYCIAIYIMSEGAFISRIAAGAKIARSTEPTKEMPTTAIPIIRDKIFAPVLARTKMQRPIHATREESVTRLKTPLAAEIAAR